MILRCTKEGGFFRLKAHVTYKGSLGSYEPWPPFIVDTGSLETYLTSRASTSVDGVAIPLKGIPCFETEAERTDFLGKFPIDHMEFEGQACQRRRADSAKLVFLSNEKWVPVAEIDLPRVYLAPLPNNVLGLDAIQRLGAFHLLPKEAYFELDESVLLKG